VTSLLVSLLCLSSVSILTFESQPASAQSERVILDTTIVLYYPQEFEHAADLNQGEIVHVRFEVTAGEEIDFLLFSEIEGYEEWVYKPDTLGEDFDWTVPKDGRYYFGFYPWGDVTEIVIKITATTPSPPELVVTEPVVTYITVSPSTFVLESESSITFTATLTDENGNPIEGKTIAWGASITYGGISAYYGRLPENWIASPTSEVTDSVGQVKITLTHPNWDNASVTLIAFFDGDAKYKASSGSSQGIILRPLREPTVVTLAPANITTNSAQLNMSLTIGYHSRVEIWFEYRKQGDLDWIKFSWIYYTNTTPDTIAGRGSILEGLSPRTTYEYRAALMYDTTTIYGDILTFTTLESTPSPLEPATSALIIIPSTFTLESGNSITLTATLTSGDNPLANKSITWSSTTGTISPQSGTTDSSGRVTVTYTAPTISTQTSVTITASFAGDAEYQASSGSSKGTVTVPPSAPRAAEFEVSNLVINPSVVEPGESVTISVTVTNVGEVSGTYTLELKEEGYDTISKSVTLDAGESRRVSFTISRGWEKTHTISIDGLSGTFTVASPEAAPVSESTTTGIFESVKIEVYHSGWTSDVHLSERAKLSVYIFGIDKNLVHVYHYQSFSTSAGGTWGGYIPSGEDGYIHMRAVNEQGEVEWWPSDSEMYKIEREGGVLGPTPTPAPTPTLTGENLSLEVIGDGIAEWTTEVAHSGSYSAKLIIPEGATSMSWALAKVHYGETLSTLEPQSFYFYSNAEFRADFVLYLDTTGDGKVDKWLFSDDFYSISGKWTLAIPGLRWGWTEAPYPPYQYGQTWQSYDYWQNLYSDATVLYVAAGLEYWAAEPEGIGVPLYVDDITINGITYNLEPSGPIPSLTPTPSPTQPTELPPSEDIKVVTGRMMEEIGDGIAEWTTEVVHSGEYSVKLTIPDGAISGSWAIIKVPYGKALSTLTSAPSFYLYANVVHHPRLAIYLDKTGDGEVNNLLLSDYIDLESGNWNIGTGGLRWGWSETPYPPYSYGETWQPYEYWQSRYGDATVLYVAVALEYWAVEPDAIGEPLYVDDVIINGLIYDLEPTPWGKEEIPTTQSIEMPEIPTTTEPIEVPPEIAEILEGLEERISRLEEAVTTGKLGATINIEVKAELPEIKNVVYSPDLNITTEIKENEVEVRVSSEVTTGKTIMINIDNEILPISRLVEILVLYDGEEIALADDYSDVLNPEDENVPEYLILLGAKGIQVLVSIPSFSLHTIAITTSPPQAPAAVFPIWVIVAVALVAIGIISAVITRHQVRRARPPKVAKRSFTSFL